MKILNLFTSPADRSYAVKKKGDKNSPGQIWSANRFRKVSIVWMLFLSGQGEFKRLFMLKEVHVTEHFSARFWNLDTMELPLVVSSSKDSFITQQ